MLKHAGYLIVQKEVSRDGLKNIKSTNKSKDTNENINLIK
jgi:hypothetical protein